MREVTAIKTQELNTVRGAELKITPCVNKYRTKTSISINKPSGLLFTREISFLKIKRVNNEMRNKNTKTTEL